jgi:glycerophosphoryl diester phosphodiesterase
MIEFDVQMSADGILVIYHDLLITIDSSKPHSRQLVSQLTYQQLKLLHPQMITLTQILDYISQLQTIPPDLYLDLKVYQPKKHLLAKLLTNLIGSDQYLKLRSYLYLASFDHVLIHSLKAQFQQKQLFVGGFGLIMEGNLGSQYFLTNDILKRVNFIAIDSMSITEKIVTICHYHSIRVFVFTVNDYSEIQRMNRLKVDGIVTDYPNLSVSSTTTE